MPDLSQLLAAGGIVGLFTAASILVVQLFRENARLRREREGTITGLKSDINDLKLENRECAASNLALQWKVNGLADILRRAGQTLPSWFFDSEIPHGA